MFQTRHLRRYRNVAESLSGGDVDGKGPIIHRFETFRKNPKRLYGYLSVSPIKLPNNKSNNYKAYLYTTPTVGKNDTAVSKYEIYLNTFYF